MKRTYLLVLLCLAALVAKAQVNISIDTEHAGATISPVLYGIFYEDINHAADGGIYAELIRNRSFEDSLDVATIWEEFLSVNGKVQMSISKDDLLNDVQGQCLHVVTSDVGDTDAGVMNPGYWGIDAVKGRQYALSLWIKVKKGNEFYAFLKGKNGMRSYATTRLNVDPTESGWQHIQTTLTSSANDPNAIVVITCKGAADFYLDMVSLFPPTYKDRPNGMRPDLAEMLEELHPKFMRFPGGCFVEGQETADNAFRWERTVGPIEERPGHWNKNWGYRTSDGLGFHEYLQLAEDLGAKPLYVCNIGIWHGGSTPVEDIGMWVDECLGALEYANGPVTSKYGALRAQNGHPEPFNLEYVEIGNENNQPDHGPMSDHYYDRYRIFRDAILKAYPNTTIIGDVASWGTDHPRWDSDEKVDLLDEHYYRSPAWFTSNFKKYDVYDRSWPHIYCGEYAVNKLCGKHGNLNGALGEAVYMMGMENNSDIVKMSSYAPIFVNENDCRWKIDMIWFNNHTSMGTPSYYAQKLMAANVGHTVLKVTEGDQILLPVRSMYTPHESTVKAKFSRPGADHQGPDRPGIVFEDMRVKIGSKETPVADSLKISTRKYTIETKAKKEGGPEGLILMFNYVDPKNYCWLNLGSMFNEYHAIECAIDGQRLVVASVPGSIEKDRWYDIRLDVDDNNVKAYLDGKEILSTTLTGPTLPGIFTSASMDEKGDELIVKIVNTSDSAEVAHLDFGKFKTEGGRLIQLRASDGTAENTLLSPTAVYPTEKHISLNADQPEFSIPPFSLNILRLERK